MASELDHPVYKDIRSLEHPAQRSAKLSQKYYAYRGVHPSWVGQSVYSLPASITLLPDSVPPASNDPLVTHPHDLRIREWTKRDQYQNREFDIWPLDRKTHKVGRRHRGGGCDYVPPRWTEDRSTKGRHRGMKWEVEQAGVENEMLDSSPGLEFLDFEWDSYLLFQQQEGLVEEDWEAGGTREIEGGDGDADARPVGIRRVQDPRSDSDSDFDIVSRFSGTSDESCWELVEA